jgi:radical SAM superfamily enzyme YgiQ (UPF0313 family)
VRILAINPWIYDFAAYDYWLKPYGFLSILTYLIERGANVDYLDALSAKISHDQSGRGKYFSETIPTPEACKNIPRYFKRYGLRVEEFRKKLPQLQYDYILLTSSMTYWYPAIIDTVKILRETYPGVPIILGGTYATLCREHAEEKAGCDKVFGNDELEPFFSFLGITFNRETFYATMPQWELFYPQPEYIVVKSSWGCPFHCSYCANPYLFKGFFRLPIGKVFNYIRKYAVLTKNFVVYDDAFLYEPEYAKTLLKQIANSEIELNFHTPNALHWKFLDAELAQLLKTCGFAMPCFGMETMDDALQKSWGGKTGREELVRGVKLLREAGYRDGEYAVYLLLGYPGQDLGYLKKDLEFLNQLGVKVSLAEFSPVPHTALFEGYGKNFSEPLLQNNSIFGCFEKEKMQEFWKIKNYAKTLNLRFH